MALFGGVRNLIRTQPSTLILRETVLDHFLWSKSYSALAKSQAYAAGLFHVLEKNEPSLMKYFLPPLEDGVKLDRAHRFSSFAKSVRPLNKSMSINVIEPTPEQVAVWKEPTSRPVVILISWLMAKTKHIRKHAEIYLKQGFDVVTLEIRPYHMLFPEKGAQRMVEELLDYLVEHTNTRPLFLHGFSVGAYMHGEFLSKMRSRPEKYAGVERRIRGQIWDSIVDYDHIPIGFPKAVTSNGIMQRALEVYIRCHMKALNDHATKHYIKSSRAFQETPITVPALFFASLADPVGVAYKIEDCAERWSASHGIPTYVKVWNESKHVSHYHMHPKEYEAELAAFLDHLGFLPRPERVASFHHDKLPTEVSKTHQRRESTV